MTTAQLTLKRGQISYLKFGAGPQLLIALHGHGDSARNFAVLAPYLSERFTVYAVDLPFHGKTQWAAEVFDTQDIAELFEALCFLEKKKTFAVMGYSFGARALLALLPQYAERYTQVFLLAPDGIHTPSLRKMFFAPQWLRSFLFHTLQKPNWLLLPCRFLHKYGLFPSKNMQFLENNLSRPHRIRRSFGMWRSLDAFATDNVQTLRILKEKALPVFVFSAKNDPYIDFLALHHFVEALPCGRLFSDFEGHRILDERLGEAIVGVETV